MQTNSKQPPSGTEDQTTAGSPLLERAHRLTATPAADREWSLAVAKGEAVACILAEWKASAELQAAGLLQGLVRSGLLATERIAAVCGPRTAELCEQLSGLPPELRGRRHGEPGAAGLAHPPPGWRGQLLVYYRIQAFCAAYHDLDLGFLWAAILWRRFSDLRHAELPRRRAYAEEGALVLGPLLDMLGMRLLKSELETWLAGADPAQSNIDAQAGRLLSTLVAEITARAPVLSTWYTGNPQIHNAEAFRVSRPRPQALNVDILMPNEPECYHALYWAHRLYMPIEGALVDSIGSARVNGYRCLSTAVMAPLPAEEAGEEDEGREVKRVRVDVRIATPSMEEINAWGLAAFHLRGRAADTELDAWWTGAEAGAAAIDSAPIGSLPEVLHVFSPHGQLFPFDRGATVVDFAYHVHSELADQCKRFRVNGEVVEPATVLHHLDLVELEHDPRAPGPTQAWLEAARTNRARSKIERFLKRRSQGVMQGQKLVEQRLRDLETHYGFNLPEYRINQAYAQAMRRLKLSRVEELFAEIAAGRWQADRLLHPLFSQEIIRQVQIPRELKLRPDQVQLAQCCKPRPGDDIVGRPHTRRGAVLRLKVHRAGCQKRLASGDGAPVVALKWRLQPRLKAAAQIEMSALDEDRLLGDAVAAIYALLPRITLYKVEAISRRGIAHCRFDLEAESQEVLDDLADSLRRLPGHSVDRVRVMSLPPSEQEEMLALRAPGVHNPYSRLPVGDREMFFGRSQDLARIAEWLRAGAGNIWLRGQKRVGKTSLLLHLKRYYLEHHEFVPVFVDFQLLGSMDTAGIFYEIASAVYSDLQSSVFRSDVRIADIGAPLRELFDHDPRGQFMAYLRSIESRLGGARLVLLLDEFSRAMDACRAGRLDAGFFLAWRGLIMATSPRISYVIVVQQKSYDSLLDQAAAGSPDPLWELFELGEQLVLRQLSEEDVHRLIEWPIRNHLEYSPEVVPYVASLTGGSPFLIQAVCSKLVTHMARSERRQVTWEDVEAVRSEFMQPTENLFAYILDAIHGIGHSITQTMALLAEESGGPVTTEQLCEALPAIEPERLRRTLHELAGQDVVVEQGAGVWLFASRLFQQWLAFNAMPE